MTVQGNGNMLIAKAMGFGCDSSSSICPSLHLDMMQYQAFLSIASIRELEEDLISPSTWEILK